MRAIVLVGLLCLAMSAFLNEDNLFETNSKAKFETYKISENQFKDYTEEQLKSLFGVKLTYDLNWLGMVPDKDNHDDEASLPKSFDARKEWGHCMREIKNQLHCGSCWAFSASEVLGDRFCIASKGEINEDLSPQDMVSCDSNDHGCHGGMLNLAWKYLENAGIVSDKCFPYVSGDGQNIPHCLHGQCVNSAIQYRKYRAVQGSSTPLTCPTQIKRELIKNGPVQTGFIVFSDFMHYKGGIYKHASGRQLGGHAVKIVGWGEEDGQSYWIVANSWGPKWGENGYFRIAFGECMFDSNAFAGQANIKEQTPYNVLKFLQ